MTAASPSAEAVLTLGDLANWRFEGTGLAVLGHPIGHSLSPPMHNAALAELARTEPRFAAWRYFRFEVPPDDLPQALDLLGARGFLGLNLTVPHKVLAVAHVAGIDPAARAAGAVNTLRRSGGGWLGFNTDGYGLAAAVRAELGRDLARTPVILLGAGGAARGAAVECLRAGCASLAIANRTAARLAGLLAELGPMAGKIPLRGFAPDRPPRDLPAGALVINATSAGLHPSDPAPVDLAALPAVAAVFDMIYNPPRTPLLAQAADLGLPAASGLAMLVHQGARALELWSGVPAARTAATMRAAAEAALGRS
jgi:shikimate dehydrogenase